MPGSFLFCYPSLLLHPTPSMRQSRSRSRSRRRRREEEEEKEEDEDEKKKKKKKKQNARLASILRIARSMPSTSYLSKEVRIPYDIIKWVYKWGDKTGDNTT
ncbi:hypothetical protein TESG_08238 [Trichophyton tonsurans CBS 112818]|uniref:Uncharacterized protein n=1 Tax=Trichophyton tonsurans (strain CBS 112818) TaxID=647933 RepID=F2RMU4_TRIT1|nr:hypothetical protein TESG_08238 [Trichophyton tonsurans CBS 112818]